MILDKFKLNGQVAVVTGGNRGLGFACAAALLQAGADLLSVQRSDNTAAIEQAAKDAGRQLQLLQLDVAEEGAAQRAFDAAMARFDKVDILVNNAGITVFLASAASDFIHGQTIAVDGGWLAR